MGTYDIEKVVSNQMIETNDVIEKKSKKSGITIYGSLLNYLEENNDRINSMAEGLGAYFAAKEGIDQTIKYEKEVSGWEKYIKNNPLKRTKMEAERTMNMELKSGFVQMSVKTGIYAVKKTLQFKEKSEVNKYVWGLCVQYANSIGLQNGDKRVKNRLQTIGKMIGKKDTDYTRVIEEFEKMPYIDFEQYQAEHIARILYTIYVEKHNWIYLDEEKQRDMQMLVQEWEKLGIYGEQAWQLIQQFELLRKANAFEFNRTSQTIHAVYGKLVVSIPDLDQKRVRQVNQELLQYVPNGDKQMLARRSAKIASKAALAAAEGIAGYVTSNPVLLTESATTAVSLFADIDNEVEKIGNCLEDQGIKKNEVADCIDNARKRQKELPALVL